MQLRRTIILLIGLVLVFSLLKYYFVSNKKARQIKEAAKIAWTGPDITKDTALKSDERALLLYGQDLIAHTSKYLGPNGTISQTTNGMNCQNCHLNAGNQPWGNNYGAVYATYPKFRDRSGKIESIYKRVSDCIERSLNGKALDSNSKEFAAIFAYIKYLGKGVEKGTKPYGSGIEKPGLLNRAADKNKGTLIYTTKCQVCHGDKGQGQILANKEEYLYPPLWGDHSYNDGAGLYRISNLAGYIKSNMPFLQSTHAKPILTDEQCWDLAAFINSQPRPHMDQSKDWPNNKKKPFDYPFGPYADNFTEAQHKFGPYTDILKNTAK